MMTLILIISLIVISLLLVIINGVLDFGRDFSKSSVIAKYVPKELLGDNDDYFNCGDTGKAWDNKWAKDNNGKVLHGVEAYKGSSTIYVFETDYFHFCKRVFYIVQAISISLMIISTVITSVNHGYIGLVFLLYPYMMESLNSAGFTPTYNKNKLFTKLLVYTQKLGYNIYINKLKPNNNEQR